LRGLKSFTVVGHHMDDDQLPERKLSLAPPDGDTLRLKISNFCPDNPLDWPPKSDEPSPDPDFRWYYELLSSSDRVAVAARLTAVGHGEVPFPIPTPDDDGKGGDDNCITSLFPPEPVTG
jgi:hypothetical protein